MGLKTTSCMDAWTFEHVLSGISIGYALKTWNLKILYGSYPIASDKRGLLFYNLVGILALAYFYECIEHYLEIGLGGSWIKHWLHGTEYWANRIIFDPLMLVLGYFLVEKHPSLLRPARFLALIWLLVHLFIFPHSMYLHEIF